MDPTDLRAGLAERLVGNGAIDAQPSIPFASCSRAPWSVPEAAPLAKRLLRVAGRAVIDTGQPDSSSEAWPNTEWIDEALWALGYQVRVLPEGGRRELKREVRTGVKARGSQALN